MNPKDQISMLTTRINSLQYQIRMQNDFKEENKRLKKGYDNSLEAINKIEKEKGNIEDKVNTALFSFKNLLIHRGKEYSKLKTNYNNDLVERMRKDNKKFEEKITILERQSKLLLDDLYNKVKQYCSGLSSGGASDNNVIDIETIKYNLQNVLNEFNFVFQEIQEILNLSSQFIAEEEEETLRNLQTIEIIVEEIDRLLIFVPNNEVIRNNILGRLGINPNNYPMNTPTIRIILTNMQEVRRKRQTQLRNILDQIKVKSANILTKKADIENEIKKAMSQISNQNKSKSKSKEGINLEDIFLKSKQTNQNNYKDLQDEVVGKIKKEMQEFNDQLTAESLMQEDFITKVKSEFMKKWAKIKEGGCASIMSLLKNQAHIHFESKLINYYQRYSDIVKVLQEKFLAPDCEIIKQSLLYCNETIDKIKNDITPYKSIILLGKKNKYLDTLKDQLVTNGKYLVYICKDSINSFYYNIDNNIRDLVGTDSFDVIFPILIIHFNDFKEFEKESNMETLLVNCLKKKVGFLFYFDIKNTKDLSPLKKKIKAFIDKSNNIQTALKDSKYILSEDLVNNLGTIDGAITLEMEKLTNFKKDIRCKIDKEALKNEYFKKMFDVYMTSHTKEEHLLNINNSDDEVKARHRTLDSIFEYSLMCVNLDKKPKKEQLKEKEQIALNQKIGKILDEIYNNNILKDFEEFIKDLINQQTFSLYISREKLMAELDLKYNSSLLTEETDGQKTQNLIYQEIESLIEKKHKKESLTFIGKLIWYSFFEQYTPKFYRLFENGFKIPEDFDQYLIDSFK